MYAILKYSGSKMNLSRKYVKLFPPTYDCFISVFGGSASEFAAFPMSESRDEVWNDSNSDLFTFFCVLQNDEQRAEFVRRLQVTVDGREQYTKCRNLLKEPTTDPVTRAWAYFVIRHTGYPSASGGWRTVWGSHGHDLVKATRVVDQWAERLKNVKLECQDFGKIISRHKRQENTFNYLDPPYHVETCSNTLYEKTLTHEDHVRLLAALQGIQGTAMVCGMDHWLYEENLWHWRRFSCCVKNRENRKYKEVIWMNYESDGHRPNKLTIAARYLDAVGGLEKAERYLNEFNNTEALKGREENENHN